MTITYSQKDIFILFNFISLTFKSKYDYIYVYREYYCVFRFKSLRFYKQ